MSSCATVTRWETPCPMAAMPAMASPSQTTLTKPPEAPAAPPPPEPLKPAAAAPPAEQTPEDRGSALRALLQQAGKLDRRQENLLNALKPFLKPERREKVDRAMQAARISRLAGAALRGRDQKDP